MALRVRDIDLDKELSAPTHIEATQVTYSNALNRFKSFIEIPLGMDLNKDHLTDGNVQIIDILF